MLIVLVYDPGARFWFNAVNRMSIISEFCKTELELVGSLLFFIQASHVINTCRLPCVKSIYAAT